MPVRVRFAPSPTGSLHLGTARSALYNWLYARHFGSDGTYVLRIEDTDRERSTREHLQEALRVFRWLGLDWDEGPGVNGPYGPYLQSERLPLYDAAIDELMESGRAYECYCTPERLEQVRTAEMKDGRAPVYDGRCRTLTEAERSSGRADLPDGAKPAIRFRVPDSGSTVVADLIHGDTAFDNVLLGDFIIRRGDGFPVYNFAVVVDDSAMHITHVIRGDDHLSNTPRQILLYEALGRIVPAFAHVPMILGEDRKKLSKRLHTTASVEDVAAAGFLPAAVRNYLALLGWSKDDETTVMSTAQLIESFDVTRVRKSPAAFDMKKLMWLNGVHARAIDRSEWASAYEGWREAWIGTDHADHRDAWVADGATIALLVQEKVDTFSQVPGLVSFLADPHSVTDDAWVRLEANDHALTVLEHASTALAETVSWTVEAVEETIRGLCSTLGIKPRDCFGAIRLAVTGRTVTPGLFESVWALGRERSLTRMGEIRLELADRATMSSQNHS